MPKKQSSSDYAGEMNQAIHRPGMQGVVNRSNADARDASGNRTGPRPTVGPADSATRKRMLNEALGESSPAPKPVPAAPAATQDAPDASGVGGRQREATIMDAVDKASS